MRETLSYTRPNKENWQEFLPKRNDHFPAFLTEALSRKNI